MATPPPQPTQLKEFLSKLVLGTAELGFASLPLIEMYKKAKAAGTSFPEMLATDPKALDGILTAVQRQADKLSPTTLAIMEAIVKQAQNNRKG